MFVWHWSEDLGLLYLNSVEVQPAKIKELKNGSNSTECNHKKYYGLCTDNVNLKRQFMQHTWKKQDHIITIINLKVIEL